MEDIFNYIVYMTINTKNNKIYVGIHKTNTTIFDGYIGCGIKIQNPSSYKHAATTFQYAVKKYGVDSFKRITIKTFKNLEDAIKLETLIVDENFIKRKDVYNMIIGGGIPPTSSVTCFKYSEDGKFLASYDSILEAAESINVSRTTLDKAIRLFYKSGGFYWSKEKLEMLDISKYSKTQSINIHSYDLLGKYLKSFDTIASACREYGYVLSSVQKSIYKGYKCKEHYFSLDYSDFLTIKNFSNRSKKQEIHQYSLQGEYIRSFNSANMVKTELGFSLHNINNAIKLNSPRNGFLWSYIKHKKLEAVKSVGNAKTVIAINDKGEIVEEFKTVRECRKKYPSSVFVLKGDRSQSKGLVFKYKDSDIV